MKKITMGLVALTFLVAKTALAAVPAYSGAYLEGNLGQSFTHFDNDGLHEDNQNGLGGNVNVGYKFNPYFAAEAGYTQYTTAKFDGSAIVGYTDDNSPVTLSANGKIKSSAIDLAAKGILPVGNSGLELFGKLGVARIAQETSTSLVLSDTYGHSEAVPTPDHSQNVITPYFGLGAQYSFTSNIVGNIQANRARGNSDTGSLDLVSAGISYLFG